MRSKGAQVTPRCGTEERFSPFVPSSLPLFLFSSLCPLASLTLVQHNSLKNIHTFFTEPLKIFSRVEKKTQFAFLLKKLFTFALYNLKNMLERFDRL